MSYATSSWSFILENSSLPLILINESEVYLDNTTIDGARVVFIYSNDVQYSFEHAPAAVCNPEGLNRQPDPASNLYSGMCIINSPQRRRANFTFVLDLALILC